MSVRAVRGAIQVDADERDQVLEASTELLTAVLERNQLGSADLISVLFTATPDLTSEFPAYAARMMGITDVPLMCASEIDVVGAMPRVLRLLAHVETELAREGHTQMFGRNVMQEDLIRPSRAVVCVDESQPKARADEAGSENEDGGHALARQVRAQASSATQIHVSDVHSGHLGLHMSQQSQHPRHRPHHVDLAGAHERDVGDPHHPRGVGRKLRREVRGGGEQDADQVR